MKKIIFSISFLLLSIGFISAQTDRPITFGIHVLAGGRYDDVRMCVASQSGVKGGPIVDIYFDIRFPAGENGTIALNIPVMRPILFGFAFSMLQFEPQVTYEYHFGEPGSPRFVLSGGLGLVFHYGPDYKSSVDNPGDSFFAMGPLFTASAGVQFPGKRGYWMPGVKVFYAPLFSPEYDTGQIFGGGVELHYEF
ncbi:MAG: hypothetical protein PF518_07730 [Spirochaetaceae bacterium]|jgi:hypothetical protein|nr:hypothetical protein [Spirochaetaceae bacterium]